jgi:hypothetical protein
MIAEGKAHCGRSRRCHPILAPGAHPFRHPGHESLSEFREQGIAAERAQAVPGLGPAEREVELEFPERRPTLQPPRPQEPRDSKERVDPLEESGQRPGVIAPWRVVPGSSVLLAEREQVRQALQFHVLELMDEHQREVRRIGGH